MKNEPCIRLGMRISPKIREKPADSRNSRPPSAMLFTARRTQTLMLVSTARAGGRWCRARLLTWSGRTPLLLHPSPAGGGGRAQRGRAAGEMKGQIHRLRIIQSKRLRTTSGSSCRPVGPPPTTLPFGAFRAPGEEWRLWLAEINRRRHLDERNEIYCSRFL